MTTNLTHDRLDEIRTLLAELAAHQDTPPVDATAQRTLLGRCHCALTDVLTDRDRLAAAHAETAEELALWTGAL